MLEVTEFRNDFQSVRHKQNQTDLKIINKLTITFKLVWAKCEIE